MMEQQRRKNDRHPVWGFVRKFESLVNTILIVGLISGAGVWWWHTQQLDTTRSADRLERIVSRLEGVTVDLTNVERQVVSVETLARSNQQAVEDLRGRISRNENAQERRADEILNRLERIETLLLEK